MLSRSLERECGFYTGQEDCDDSADQHLEDLRSYLQDARSLGIEQEELDREWKRRRLFHDAEYCDDMPTIAFLPSMTSNMLPQLMPSYELECRTAKPPCSYCASSSHCLDTCPMNVRRILELDARQFAL